MLSKVTDRPVTRPITRPVTPDDMHAIAALHARVFGPGRFARTAYRVREGAPDKGFSRFCRVAINSGEIIAALRMTEIAIGGTGGALLLGPLAVAPEYAGQGFGRMLVAEVIEAAEQGGIKLIVLVGDEPYYGRFGFKPIKPGKITLPGPVNPARLLAAELEAGALTNYAGVVTAV